MHIYPPMYRRDAVICTRGWKVPGTGELLECKRFSLEQVEWYNDQKSDPITPPPVEPEPDTDSDE